MCIQAFSERQKVMFEALLTPAVAKNGFEFLKEIPSGKGMTMSAY